MPRHILMEDCPEIVLEYDKKHCSIVEGKEIWTQEGLKNTNTQSEISPEPQKRGRGRPRGRGNRGRARGRATRGARKSGRLRASEAYW